VVQVSIDDLLAQATYAVLIDGKITGTAWLVSDEGHLLTAGHLLGTQTSLNQVEVCIGQDSPRKANKIQWAYQPDIGINFAVLRLEEIPTNRFPLPIALERSVTGTFRLSGYGKSLQHRSVGVGNFIGSYDPQDSISNRMFLLSSAQLSEPGYGGGAVFSDELQAVVAIQTQATSKQTGAGRDTIVAMPLYRIANIWEPLSVLRERENRITKEARILFEPSLRAVGLGVEQIKSQTERELRQSLQKLYETIKNPEAFGELEIQSVGNEVKLITSILPILLERKKIVLDRINEQVADKLHSSGNSLISQHITSSVNRLSIADPSNVQEIAASQIELLSTYHNVVLKQAKDSFQWAIIAAGIGFIFLLISVFFVLYLKSLDVAVISLIGGVLIEFISAINFYLYGKTSTQMASFQSRLDKTQRFLLANSLCEGLDADHKQKSRSELIQTIAGITSHNIGNSIQ